MTQRSTSTKIVLAPLLALGVIVLGGVASPAGASTKATTVKAVETEFHIALSKKTFSPGSYTFVAENKGKVTHALQISGPGLHNAATPDIAPGKSADLKVTFKSGKYDIFCPVPGHKMLGMNVNVVVSSTGGHTSANKSTTGNSTAGGGGTAF
jgi:ABC-type transport system substrate-binding protein